MTALNLLQWIADHPDRAVLCARLHVLAIHRGWPETFTRLTDHQAADAHAELVAQLRERLPRWGGSAEFGPASPAKARDFGGGVEGW